LKISHGLLLIGVRLTLDRMKGDPPGWHKVVKVAQAMGMVSVQTN
jgi:hypothetical protein